MSREVQSEGLKKKLIALRAAGTGGGGGRRRSSTVKRDLTIGITGKSIPSLLKGGEKRTRRNMCWQRKRGTEQTCGRRKGQKAK